MPDIFLPKHVVSTLISETRWLALDKVPWRRYCDYVRNFIRDFQVSTPEKSIESRYVSQEATEAYTNIGISIIDLSTIDSSFKNTDDIPPLFFACGGSTELFRGPFATVLNSRKPRLLNPRDFWLRGTVLLADNFSRAGFTVVSSTGTAGYDILTYTIWKINNPLVLVVDHALPPMLPDSEHRKFTDKYDWLLKGKKTVLISPFPSNSALERRKRMVLRDRIVTMLSNTIAIAEISGQGNMVFLAKEAINTGKKVQVLVPDNFTHQSKGNKILLKEYSEQVGTFDLRELSKRTEISGAKARIAKKQNKSLARILNTFPPGYLVHFTRQRPGPWPGQSYLEYLESLAKNQPEAHHTAFQTLKRILRDGLIRASSKMYRGNTPVVSLTGCLPDEILQIARWNPALVRWTFEPYGIAFPKKNLETLGAEPVFYGKNSDYSKLPKNKRHLFQLHEPPEKSWKQEKEWRIMGDLSLSAFEPNDLLVIVKRREEAEEIANEFSLTTYVVHP